MIWKPVDIQSLFDGIGTTCGCQSLFFSKPGNLIHTDSDCLPMAFSFIIIILLDRMSQCMTKVQQHPFTGIKLVMFYYNPLNINAACDDPGQFRLQVFKRSMAD